MSRESARASRESSPASVVPTGELKRLHPSDIKPSTNNPRLLFDKVPLAELKENIRQHGVLVPITVYPIRGQEKYAILDGERRYRCCVELQDEGIDITIPANIVNPPDPIANVLYMFSIHNFREAWELMPTALSLKLVMDALHEADTTRLSKLTGLSEPQIERCKILLQFPKRFQDMSLDPDPATRIPSNFWIEASPVLDLTAKLLPDVARPLGRDGITDLLVAKYRAKKIKSVIHFRRIMEAYELHGDSKPGALRIASRLREYITTQDLETRKAFDEFVLDNRRIQSAVRACDEFVGTLRRAKLEHAVERRALIRALIRVSKYVQGLLEKLSGSEEPLPEEDAPRKAGG